MAKWLVTLSIVALSFSARHAEATPTAAEKCAAAKSKIVGAYFLCLQKSQAKATLNATPPDTTKCDAVFLEKWQQIESKGMGSCPDGVIGDEIRRSIEDCAETSASIVSGSARVPTCGDGAINVAGEICDGPDLGGMSCTSLGFTGGTLTCTTACRFETSACTNSSCAATSPGYTAPNGCTCADTWTYSGNTYCNGGCANPNGDPNGPWCFTEATCNGQNWAYCQASGTGSGCSAGAAGYTPPAGCACLDTWSYNGKTYCNGQCGTPNDATETPWCYTSSTCNGANWSYCSQ